MPSWPATRRASSAASSEQQLFLNGETLSATSWSRIQTPTTSSPASARRAAATDESTPPDMATSVRLTVASRASDRRARCQAPGEDALAQRFGGEGRRAGAHLREDPRHDLHRRVDLLVGRRPAE